MWERSGDKAGRLKVFISYSRADEVFADELYAGLEHSGFEATMDRVSIRQGEDWKHRLGALIADAQTVVFILSPDSARSAICQWEVDHAHGLAKRIIPVSWRALGERPIGAQPDGQPWPAGTVAPPPRLSALNFVRFDPHEDGRPRSFMKGLRELVRALEDDLDWLRDHSRLLTRAREWEEGARPANRLLSGADVAAAKSLVDRRKPSAPPFTELQLDFLKASEAEEERKAAEMRANSADRMRLAAEREAAASKAEAEARRAAQAAELAETAQKERLAALAAAQAAALETTRSQRRAGRRLWAVTGLAIVLLAGAAWQTRNVVRREQSVFSSLASRAMDEGRFERAMRFALQADAAPGSLPGLGQSPDLESYLAAALTLDRRVAVFSGNVALASFTTDGQHVLTMDSRADARFWKAGDGSLDSEQKLELKGILEAHASAVNDLTFTPDRKSAVTISGDTARVFDLATGSETARLSGHEGHIGAVALSSDGSHIATAAADHTGKLWRFGQSTPRATLRGHSAELRSIAFSADGKFVVTASDDKTARVWNAETGAPVHELRGHNMRVRHAIFSPDGQRVATASEDDSVRLWDMADGRERMALRVAGAANHVAFDPSGNYLAAAIGSFFTGNGDIATRIWDLGTGREVAALFGHSDIVKSVAFSRGGTRLLTRSLDGTARLWRLDRPTVIRAFGATSDELKQVEISDDRKQLMAHLADRTLRGWNVDTGVESFKLDTRLADVTGIRLAAGSDVIATSHDDGKLRIWRSKSPQTPPVVLDAKVERIGNVHFGAGGERIAVVEEAGAARLWNVTDGKPIGYLTNDQNDVEEVELALSTTDGSAFVTTVKSGTARVRDAITGRTIGVFESGSDPIKSLANGPDPGIVAIVTDKAIQLWHLPTRNLLRSIQSGRDKIDVMAVQFDRSGRHIIAHMSNLTTQIHRVDTGELTATMYDRAEIMHSIDANPDGRHVISIGTDGFIGLWNATSGNRIATLNQQPDRIRTAWFDDNGQRLIVHTLDNRAMVLDVSPLALTGEAIRSRACSALGNSDQWFTRDELADPILGNIERDDIVARNPCQRRGPLSRDYWSDLLQSLWPSRSEAAD